jgi:hypothetical protein
MRSPSSEEILAIWEAALAEHPIDRALTIASAFSGHTKRTLAQLPVGVRDSLLFRARECLFGPRLETFAECPSCAGSLEFAVTIDELPLSRCSDLEIADSPGVVYETPVYETKQGLQFRLPNSFDLAAIAAVEDVGQAERLLLCRCILKDDFELDDRSLEDINRAIAERDPAADLELAMTCPACGRRWTQVLDIASFFWRELNSFARRLLGEVDTLARAYGWPEREILQLSPARRAMYLEMVTGT